MALTLTTAPTTEPVTVDELKEHLRIDADEDDAYLLDCIKAAREWVEGQTKRAIMDQTWTYSIDYYWPTRSGYHRIDLPLNPVPAETSPSTCTVTYVDSNGASQTLAQTQYTLVGRTHGSYIVPAYDVTWPDLRCVPNAITVQFQAGNSSSVPQELKRAIMVLAGHFYEVRETADKAPMAVEAMISPYRRARVL